MPAQDSSDPTGIVGPARATSTYRARNRKANAALQMALAGASWDEIALALGYPTARSARVAVENALERQLTRPTDRAKMRQLAGLRLDRLLRSVWPTAIDPQNPDQLLAVAKARDLIADHRKLYGLDAPTEITVHNPTETELQMWVAKVVAMDPSTVAEYDIIDGEVLEGSPDDVPTGEVPRDPGEDSVRDVG